MSFKESDFDRLSQILNKENMGVPSEFALELASLSTPLEAKVEKIKEELTYAMMVGMLFITKDDLDPDIKKELLQLLDNIRPGL